MVLRIIAVIGAGEAHGELCELAREVGGLLARAGCILVTGGLGGVMEAASAGASAAGGLVVGILPGATVRDANACVTVPIATGLGDARNVVIANTAEAFIAIGGGHGTLSEIAFARKRQKRVAALRSWQIDAGVFEARDPAEAVAHALGG